MVFPVESSGLMYSLRRFVVLIVLVSLLCSLLALQPQHRDMSERQKTPERDHNTFLLNQTKVNSTPQHHGTSEASSHLNSLT
jgi:hypothetical protein